MNIMQKQRKMLHNIKIGRIIMHNIKTENYVVVFIRRFKYNRNGVVTAAPV